MALLQSLKSLVNERLSAAAEELFSTFGSILTEYEDEAFHLKEEIYHKRRLLDTILKPYIKLHRADIPQILDDEISADFYVAVPEILPKLLPLKNKLRKKFPKAKRGSVGIDIPKMMAVFTSGHEYAVERDCYVVTQIGTMDMPREKLLDNLQAVVIDVCKHRPDTYGHFIERAIISSHTSEALWFKSEDIPPLSPV